MNIAFQALFYLLAAVLLGAAAYFYSNDETDRVFACSVLAACCFFLGLRSRLKKNIAAGMSADDSKD